MKKKKHFNRKFNTIPVHKNVLLSHYLYISSHQSPAVSLYIHLTKTDFKLTITYLNNVSGHFLLQIKL